MRDSELRTRAKTLGLHVIAACDEVDTRKGRGVLVNQIVRSATSIGANIHEAAYAASKADFINKFHIALKECNETEYWIEMLTGAGAISAEKSEIAVARVRSDSQDACKIHQYSQITKRVNEVCQ